MTGVDSPVGVSLTAELRNGHKKLGSESSRKQLLVSEVMASTAMDGRMASQVASRTLLRVFEVRSATPHR